MAPHVSYVPIDCSVHDHLESLAVRRDPVSIRCRGEDGTERTLSGTITDVWAEGGVERLRLSDGSTVRLDELLEVVSDRSGWSWRPSS